MADTRGDAWGAALRGVGLALLGDLEAAARALRPLASHLRPDVGQQAQGLLALMAGEQAVALRAFDRAVRAGGSTSELFYWRGITLLALGRRQAAELDLERAVTLDAGRPETALALAAVRGDPAMVVEAASREPNLLATIYYPDVRRGLVRLCARLLRDLPAPEQLRTTIAHLYYEARLPYEAEASLVGDDSDEARALVGRIALDRLDVPRAIEGLSAAARGDGRDSRALYDLARALLASGRRSEALGPLRRALEADPGNPVVLAAAGEMARLQGDLDRARELSGYALARSPSFAPALRLQGQVLLARGEFDEAAAALQQAARLVPLDPEVWLALARLAEQRRLGVSRVRAFEARAGQASHIASALAARVGKARAISVALRELRRAVLDRSATTQDLAARAAQARAPRRALEFARAGWLALQGRRDEARRVAAQIAGSIPIARWARHPKAENVVSVSGTVDGRRVRATAVQGDLVSEALSTSGSRRASAGSSP